MSAENAALVVDEWTDTWTCNVGFASGLPVRDTYHGWPSVSRRCRAVNPIFYKSCRRCGLPQGWETRKREAESA
jgi:ribosomal protein L40E